MAKRKRQGPRQNATPTKAPVTLDTLSKTVVPNPTIPSPPEVQSRVRRVIKRFADWAIKKALDFFLVGVIAVMTAPTLAIWVYFRSGRAAWTYPWLDAALGFIAACLVLIGASLLLIYAKAQRRKAVERAKSLEFVSRDKGWLDHMFHRDRAIKSFNAVLIQMSEELQRIINAMDRGRRRLELLNRPPSTQLSTKQAEKRSAKMVIQGLKIAADSAASYNKYSTRLENQLSRLTEIIDLLIESNVGYMSSPAATLPERLVKDRNDIDVVLTITRSSLESTRLFRDSLAGLKGNSQELNTAINRLINLTGGINSQMQRMETHWVQLSRIIDDKLGEELGRRK